VSSILSLFVLGLLGLGYAVLCLKVLLRVPPEMFTDWDTFYRAATELRTGAGAQLYAAGLRMREMDSYEWWWWSNTHGQGAYLYPPLFAVALVPLTWLSNQAAGAIWLVVLSLAVVGFILAMVHVLQRPLRLETAALVAIPVLAGAREGPISSIQFGQPDILLLLLLTLSVWAALRQRDIAAGVLLGLAVCVKPTLAVVGLFYLRKRRWTTLATATATGVVAGLGPFLLLGPPALSDWLAIGEYFGTGSVVVYSANMSLRALLQRAFSGGPFTSPLLDNPILGIVLWAVAAVTVLLVWWRSVSAGPGPRGQFVVEYAFTIAVMLFVAPYSEYNHYTAVLLPLAVLADRAAWAPASKRWALLAVAACLYFAQPWLLQGNTLPGLPNGLRLLASTSYLYGLVLVGAALLLLLRHERRRVASQHGVCVRSLPDESLDAGSPRPDVIST
jgi:hypothetical protein